MWAPGVLLRWAKGIGLGLAWAQQEITLPVAGDLLAVDPLHHLYVWSAAERSLYKVWAPRYDSLTRIGGAPGEEGFLGVSALAPVGNQQLYVLDAEGQQILLLGTNLQPLQRLLYSQLPPEVVEGYPALLTAGPAGELYLLVRQTQEIVKIDFFGRVLVRFGGKTYGPGRIVAAGALTGAGELIGVVDTTLRQVLRYDRWGTFLDALPYPSWAEGAAVGERGLFFWSGQRGLWQPWQGEASPITLPTSPQVVVLQESRLYWLAGRRLGWLPLP
ncbi:MAG: hypothetical protein KatS3mg026_0249 [Bacteroidia bacterium]|nr:MAG: hypothetical protein KatS3mg026_0249 [Bacteroidia bacterium]